MGSAVVCLARGLAANRQRIRKTAERVGAEPRMNPRRAALIVVDIEQNALLQSALIQDPPPLKHKNFKTHKTHRVRG